MFSALLENYVSFVQIFKLSSADNFTLGESKYFFNELHAVKGSGVEESHSWFFRWYLLLKQYVIQNRLLWDSFAHI